MSTDFGVFHIHNHFRETQAMYLYNKKQSREQRKRNARVHRRRITIVLVVRVFKLCILSANFVGTRQDPECQPNTDDNDDDNDAGCSHAANEPHDGMYMTAAIAGGAGPGLVWSLVWDYRVGPIDGVCTGGCAGVWVWAGGPPHYEWCIPAWMYYY